jgi:predicted nucleic acid-binding protein
MRVLLDTCVLTELRHPRGNGAVKAAVAPIPDNDLYLSALILGEIARGIGLLSNERKQRSLSTWLTTLKNQFADRILPVDHETAHLWGSLSARAQQAGLTLPVIDGLLAATALRHGLHVMTHNTIHFRAAGVLIIDPWKESEDGNQAEFEPKIE